jgi:predicted transcriptional regulator
MTRRYDDEIALTLLRKLDDQTMSFTTWLILSRVTRQTFNEYRKMLLTKKLVKYDPVLRMYHLTDKGSTKIQEAEDNE